MGALSRRKGAGFEREAAAELRRVWPEAKRGLGQARDASEVPDVEGTPFWPECKRGKRVNIRAAIAQALEASKADGRPVLVVSREDGREALATLRLCDFLDMAAKLERLEAFAAKTLAQVASQPPTQAQPAPPSAPGPARG